MKILFIPMKGNLEPWYSDFVAAVNCRCPVVLFNLNKPVAQQFAGSEFVAELGGVVATHEMIDAAAANGVKLWQILGAGVDHVDVPYFVQKGISVANTPGCFSAVALAEHALFLMLYIAKNFSIAQRHAKSGIFHKPIGGEELEGKTLGLIGLGASGRELARRAWPMGMHLMAIDVVDVPRETLAELHIDFFSKPDAPNHLLAESDFVSIHTPLTSQTRNMIDRHALGQMKRSAVLINVARGQIVDEQALVEALQQGLIAAAGLDVFAQEPLDPSHPFLHMDNVVVTPHLAGVTRGTSRRRGQAAADNIFRVAQGLAPLYEVPYHE